MDSDESLERTLADVEMIQAAYPDEIEVMGGVLAPDRPDDNLHDLHGNTAASSIPPLSIKLRLSSDTHIVLEFPAGYPLDEPLCIVSYRCPSSLDKARVEATLSAIRTAASTCHSQHCEAGLVCCAAAMETWNQPKPNHHEDERTGATHSDECVAKATAATRNPTQVLYNWITGDPFVDRKSTFQAHVCRVQSEQAVREALQQLLDSSSKLQRASHNMFAYRLLEQLPDTNTLVQKFDNDDDGEDGAGKCLAHLLQVRKEQNVMVVVTRWFGGIHLGSKRFAHISNVARQLLVQCHELGVFNDGV